MRVILRKLFRRGCSVFRTVLSVPAWKAFFVLCIPDRGTSGSGRHCTIGSRRNRGMDVFFVDFPFDPPIFRGLFIFSVFEVYHSRPCGRNLFHHQELEARRHLQGVISLLTLIELCDSLNLSRGFYCTGFSIASGIFPVGVNGSFKKLPVFLIRKDDYIDPMMNGGLITFEKVQVMRYCDKNDAVCVVHEP